MAFSYTLFLVLLLIFPGLCAYTGMRAGDRRDLLAPRPETPGSTATLATVVLGTIVGHLAGAGGFAAQAWWCAHGPCMAVGFDPNVYRVMLAGGHPAATLPDAAIFAWLCYLLGVGAATGVAFHRGSRLGVVRRALDPVAFGWLHPIVEDVAGGRSFVLGYVLTRTAHDGTSLAFEGTVERLALGADQQVAMIVLGRVERFAVRIDGEGHVARVNTEGQRIARLQIAGDQIANVALEVITIPDDVLPIVGDGERVDA